MKLWPRPSLEFCHSLSHGRFFVLTLMREPAKNKSQNSHAYVTFSWMLLLLISQLFNWCWSNQTEWKPKHKNINFSSLLNFKSFNSSWLMSFYISEQKTYEVLPENTTDLRNGSSPYWKDYAFGLQTYSLQDFVEWISQSISKAVYNCIMLEESQNSQTSGQSLLSRLLSNNHVMANRGLFCLTKN